jgi:hypothetical protein
MSGFQTNIDLQAAVDLWCSNNKKSRYQAELRFGPISKWNVSNVTDMNNLFKGKVDFNEDISDWDVSHVKDMSNMFLGAAKFNQPLYKWKISAGTNQHHMFQEAHLYNQWKGMSSLQTLYCCLYEKDIPVELRVIIHRYYCLPIDTFNLSNALRNWNNAESKLQACLKYGDVFDWSLSTRVFQSEFTDLDTIAGFLNGLDQLIDKNVSHMLTIRDAGWIRPLLDLLTHHNDEVIVTLVLSVLKKLAATDPYPEVIRALGCIPHLIELLAHSFATHRKSTAMVLQELSLADTLNRHIIREEGGLLSLLGLLGDSDVNVCKACLDALANLANDPVNALFIQNNGFIEVLLQLLKEQDEKVRISVLRILQHLALHIDDGSVLYAEGVTKELIVHFKDSNTEVRKESILAYGHFAMRM